MDPSQRPRWWAGVLSTVVVPLAVGGFTITGSTFAGHVQPWARPLDALGIALLLVGPAALGLRRVQPVPVLGVAATAGCVYLGIGYPFGPARTALAAIKQSSRELLHEMRATLGVLRGVDERPPHQPVPGLARLDAFATGTRAGGLPVTVEIHGPPRELPASVDLAAYRIVQEALTNTRKHAGPARAHVVLRYEERGLTVQVDDDGLAAATAPGTSGGNGLPGMRERAQALGGTITAGPRPGGGFRVQAFLPAVPVAATPAEAGDR